MSEERAQPPPATPGTTRRRPGESGSQRQAASAAGHDSAGGAWERRGASRRGQRPAERASWPPPSGRPSGRTGSLMQLMGQAAADRIGINATDLNCLNILSFSGQMTAGELARATGLTTASITGVVGPPGGGGLRPPGA